METMKHFILFLMAVFSLIIFGVLTLPMLLWVKVGIAIFSIAYLVVLWTMIPTEKDITTERLEQIADHLESGKLIHKHFDFKSFNTGVFDGNGCGTAGCAVGEFPAIWPKDWGFRGLEKFADSHLEYYPCLISYIEKPDRPDTFEQVSEWLGISNSEAGHLFAPRCQDTGLYGGKRLFDDATKEDVAQNIRAFIKMRNKRMKMGRRYGFLGK